MLRMRGWRGILPCLLAEVLSFVAATAGASTYYVDGAGDDAASGSAAAPWRTIQHAASQSLAGDTVIVRPGIYAESVTVANSGTAAAPITYRGLNGAVLESPDASASMSAFDVGAGVAYVTLDGFEIRGGYHETVFVRSGAEHITVLNCNVHDNRLGMWLNSAAYVEIRDCQFRRNSSRGVQVSGTSQHVTVRNTVSADNDDGRGCSGDADGFTVSETASDVVFLDSQASGNGEDGFDLQGNDVLVSRSISQDNGCAGIKVNQNGRVENTIVSGNKTGITTNSQFNVATTVEIVSSTVADNRGIQLHLKVPNSGGAQPVAYGVLVRNVIASGSGKAIEVEESVVLTEDHNLLFREETTSAVLVRHLGAGVERRYSGQAINAGLWTAESGQGVGTFAINPDFLGAGQYAVAAQSVAIDGGESTAAPADDRSGVARPQGNRVDIGPDEWPEGVNNHRPWADPGPNRTATVGSPLNFSGYGSVDTDGDALAYSWDFGDGSAAATGYSASHSYAGASDYTVTLTVSDGQSVRSRVIQVNVSAAPTKTPTPTSTSAPPTPTPAAAVCGDGIIAGGEQCDDANDFDGDGCDSNCTSTGCGNGIVSGAEECDDGNQISVDGCTAACTLCGDGVVTTPEQCDDGNLDEGDVCHADCRKPGHLPGGVAGGCQRQVALRVARFSRRKNELLRACLDRVQQYKAQVAAGSSAGGIQAAMEAAVKKCLERSPSDSDEKTLLGQLAVERTRVVGAIERKCGAPGGLTIDGRRIGSLASNDLGRAEIEEHVDFAGCGVEQLIAGAYPEAAADLALFTARPSQDPAGTGLELSLDIFFPCLTQPDVPPVNFSLAGAKDEKSIACQKTIGARGAAFGAKKYLLLRLCLDRLREYDERVAAAMPGAVVQKALDAAIKRCLQARSVDPDDRTMLGKLETQRSKAISAIEKKCGAPGDATLDGKTVPSRASGDFSRADIVRHVDHVACTIDELVGATYPNASTDLSILTARPSQDPDDAQQELPLSSFFPCLDQ